LPEGVRHLAAIDDEEVDIDVACLRSPFPVDMAQRPPRQRSALLSWAETAHGAPVDDERRVDKFLRKRVLIRDPTRLGAMTRLVDGYELNTDRTRRLAADRLEHSRGVADRRARPQQPYQVVVLHREEVIVERVLGDLPDGDRRIAVRAKLGLDVVESRHARERARGLALGGDPLVRVAHDCRVPQGAVRSLELKAVAGKHEERESDTLLAARSAVGMLAVRARLVRHVRGENDFKFPRRHARTGVGHAE